jgi:4-hydroxybenzoyl-CoA reductase alpha subunit
MVEYAVVGKRLPRVDSQVKATGEALFTTDMTLPKMLYGKILRSPHPHARILHIDTSMAKRLAGVKAVITGKDTLGIRFGIHADQQALPVDKVRYIGDEVAAVAATDEDLAEEALGLIKVEYEVLPAVFDPLEAIKPGAPQIHEGVKNNVSASPGYNIGDVEKGYAESDYVREDVFTTQTQFHCTLESRSALASYDATGKLTVWSSNQAPYPVGQDLAKTLGMPLGKVRMIKPFMGGGFGAKREMLAADFCASLLSIKSGRPVKITYTREEEFIATRRRHPMHLTLKTGVKKDGTLMAKELTIVADGGAYNSRGPAVVTLAGMEFASLYRCDNVWFKGYHVYTNNPVGGPFRGFGQVQLRFADETQLDMIAEAIGMDPVELRLKNAVQSGDLTASKRRITSCGFSDCIRKVAEESGWQQKRSSPTPNRGVGIACNDYVVGARSLGGPDSSSAFVKLHDDGTVSLLTGAADIGQGSDTTLSQIAAEELGMALDDIRITAADTEITPTDLGTFGSRVTFTAGNAVKMAAADAKRQLFEVVAEKLEANIEDLEARDGRVYVKGSPGVGMSIADAVKEGILIRGTHILGRGSYSAPSEPWDYQSAQGNLSPAYSYGVQIAEVQVDPETGRIDVLNVTAACDCGFAINPMALEGQIEGAVVCGVGMALYEDWYHENGLTLNPSYLEYKVPTSLDSPAVDVNLVEPIDPLGPFGAKGVSEGAQVPVAAAVANAVYDAIGVRIKDLPITPAKILKALEEKKTKSA